MPPKIKHLLPRLLPESLVARVYLLYSGTLLLFICIGLGVFYQAQIRLSVQDAQDSSTMLIEVVAQVIGESAVIGDYDTIKRTLDKAVTRSQFDSATFIDLDGGEPGLGSPADESGASSAATTHAGRRSNLRRGCTNALLPSCTMSIATSRLAVSIMAYCA